MATARQPLRITALVMAAALAFVLFVDLDLDRLESGPDGAPPRTAEGSAVPCQVPLSWRVGRVDPGFRVSRADVAAAVSRAAALWHTVTGRTLFRRDPRNGIPIDLEYGRRQSDLQDHVRSREAVESLQEELRATRQQLRKRGARLQAERERLARRQEALNRRVSRYNRRAERLNSGQGATRTEVRELQRTRRELESERDEIESLRREIEERERRLRQDQQEFRRRIGEFEGRVEELASEPRPAPTIAGYYNEKVTTLSDGRVSVSDRSITVFRFADREALARIIAHEFGHALGLGHGGDSTSVMAETAVDDAGRGGILSVTPSDLEMLRARCPELASGGQGRS